MLLGRRLYTIDVVTVLKKALGERKHTAATARQQGCSFKHCRYRRKGHSVESSGVQWRSFELHHASLAIQPARDVVEHRLLPLVPPPAIALRRCGEGRYANASVALCRNSVGTSHHLPSPCGDAGTRIKDPVACGHGVRAGAPYVAKAATLTLVLPRAKALPGIA